jgi:hypothetical protein
MEEVGSDGQVNVSMIFTAENGFRVESGLGYNSAGLNRMNARHRVFMEPFKKDFEGSSVLDLASHDGRWSWAALRLGAKHVTGIEARKELIEKGRHLFEGEEPAGRSTFIHGDIFEKLPAIAKSRQHFDVILCLGIFYHVMDHFLLLRLIRSFNAKLVILDTGLINDERPYIDLAMEETGNFLNAIKSVPDQKQNVIGRVSCGGLKLMCKALGFSCEFLDWKAFDFPDRSHLADYLKEAPGRGQRYTAILRPT